MKRKKGVFSIIAAVTVLAGTSAQPFTGPLRLVDQTPTQLLFLQPFPDTAVPLAAGRWGFNWDNAVTNTILHEGRDEVVFHLNLETLRSVLSMRRGVGARAEVGVQVPILYYYEGVLDGFIRSVERMFGAQRNIRRREPDEEYVYSVKPFGEPALEAKEGHGGFGDVSVHGKWLAAKEGRWAPAMAVRAAVELPTGDESEVLGNGAVDWSVGALAEKDVGAVTLYANADVVVPGDSVGGLDPTPFWNGLLAVDWPVVDELDLIIQCRYGQMSLVNASTTDLVFGAGWRVTPSTVIQAGFAEDVLNSSSLAADLSLFLNLSVQP